MTPEQQSILNFLLGSGDIDGVGFGGDHPTEKGQFWWRKKLRKAFLETKEPEQPHLDTVRLDWLDTLPSGIVIPSDASFPHGQSVTPKEPGISHIRKLIDQNRASREALKKKNNG